MAPGNAGVVCRKVFLSALLALTFALTSESKHFAHGENLPAPAGENSVHCFQTHSSSRKRELQNILQKLWQPPAGGKPYLVVVRCPSDSTQPLEITQSSGVKDIDESALAACKAITLSEAKIPALSQAMYAAFLHSSSNEKLDVMPASEVEVFCSLEIVRSYTGNLSVPQPLNESPSNLCRASSIHITNMLRAASARGSTTFLPVGTRVVADVHIGGKANSIKAKLVRKSASPLFDEKAMAGLNTLGQAENLRLPRAYNLHGKMTLQLVEGAED